MRKLFAIILALFTSNAFAGDIDCENEHLSFEFFAGETATASFTNKTDNRNVAFFQVSPNSGVDAVWTEINTVHANNSYSILFWIGDLGVALTTTNLTEFTAGQRFTFYISDDVNTNHSALNRLLNNFPKARTMECNLNNPE